MTNISDFFFAKGQIKPKADWRALDSPKKQMNEFVLFAYLLFTANKTNSFIPFFGESTVRPNCFLFFFNVCISGPPRQGLVLAQIFGFQYALMINNCSKNLG